ncbi:MAG TPA: alpha/beta hydrolase [Caulobacteraceae bacterium]
MGHMTAVDEMTGRKFYVDEPDDLQPGEEVTFILNLHGGGSVGAWQRLYFPAADYCNAHRLVIATPSAATKEPARRWVGEADDAHLRSIVAYMFDRYGAQAIRAFWLAGHSQGGMTSSRLLREDPFFQERVDGWLSLSGGRIGPAERASDAGPPPAPGRPPMTFPRMPPAGPPPCDFSFIFAVGEHEIASLPETSPWAEKYGAGPRERRPDIVDTEPGQIHDTTREAYSTKAWGLKPGPGTAQVWVYPGAKDGRVVADVVRLGKGHTEGLERRVTEEIVRLMVSAPGGKVRKSG